MAQEAATEIGLMADDEEVAEEEDDQVGPQAITKVEKKDSNMNERSVNSRSESQRSNSRKGSSRKIKRKGTKEPTSKESTTALGRMRGGSSKDLKLAM